MENRKIVKIEDLKRIRKENKKIVFCSGCFDILHSGHVYFFKQCKEFGGILVVDIGSDKIIRDLKGPDRPINSQNNRAFLVSNLQDVDYAIIGGEEMIEGKIDFKEIMEELKPDVFVLNDDDSGIEAKKTLCNQLGIGLKLVPRILPENLDKTSSTKIINKVKK